MRNTNVQKMAVTAMIAALYFALSLPFMTLIFGPVQLRIAEALTLLPVFSVNPIAGLTLGCILVNTLGAMSAANILGPLDILFGSAATLIAAFLTHYFRNVRFKGLPLLSALMPVLCNGIVIGLELTFVMSGGFELPLFLVNAGQVALGEFISCFALGLPLIRALEKTGLSHKLFSQAVKFSSPANAKTN